MATTRIALNGYGSPPDDGPHTVGERIDLLATKIDTLIESTHGDVKLLLDRLDLLSTELRREIAVARKEHWADHRLLRSMLKEYGGRREAVERTLQRRRDDGSP